MSEERKKIAVIGAGISGLAAGVYLANSGFDVTIYEQHILPGGLSTGWSRKGYFFEGGMHWLTGSHPSQDLYRVWRQVGALQENNPVVNRPVITSVLGGMPDGSDLHLYRDLNKLREHLKECSPEDFRAIKKLCRDAKKFEAVQQPIGDIAGLKTDMRLCPSLGSLIAMLPAGLSYTKLRNQSYSDYLSMFRNKDIRTLMNYIISTEENALAFIYTLSAFTKGDSGFPTGGSMLMAQNMADRFTSLGGKILYKTKVQGVHIQDSVADGVIIDGQIQKADGVLIAFDTLSAVNNVLKDNFSEPWVKKMQRNVVREHCMFIGLGVKAELSRYPFSMALPIEGGLEMGGIKYNAMRVYNYGNEKGYSPEGSSTLTCLLLGDSYEWWRQKKEDGTYAQEKQKLLDVFCAELEKHIPEIKGKIEVRDLATPCTYERYTSCYNGSWMSLWPPRTGAFKFPAKAKTVRGLYFANQRNKMPGGLPMCVWSGRNTAQVICRDFRTRFRCKSLDSMSSESKDGRNE